jgi:hypothetical protein
MGEQTNAMGEQTNAMGEQTNAMGEQTNAMGEQANAMGEQANAMGEQTNAMGEQKKRTRIIPTAPSQLLAHPGPVAVTTGRCANVGRLLGQNNEATGSVNSPSPSEYLVH